MNEKLSKKEFKLNFFGSPLLTVGLIFLFNPLVGLVDFLPDFIGYFFLIAALDVVKRLNGDIEYGVSRLKYLCGVSFLFFILMFNTFKMDSSWNLTLTFSYMALTVMLGLGACNSIFNGIDYLTDRHGSNDAPSAYEPRFMTRVYIVAKALLVFIPEIFAIIEVDSQNDLSPNSNYNSILRMEKYVVVFCVLVSIVLAIVWLRYIFRFIKALKKDEKLNLGLREMYLNDYSRDGIPVKFFGLYVGNALILISHVFVYDFVIDTIHFLPEFLSAVFSAFGLLLIRNYVNLKGIFKYFALAIVFQGATFVYKMFFVENIVLELWDITVWHLAVGAVIALGYIVFTFSYFRKVHQITADSYEKIFGWKSMQDYRLGEVFFFIALSAGGANIICPIWRPTFSGTMIITLFISIYHYSKLYTRFDINK